MVVLYLLIYTDVARLGLVAGAFEPCLGLGHIDAGAVGRHGHFVVFFVFAQVLLLEHVVQTNLAGEVDVGEAHGHPSGLVAGIIYGEGAARAVQHLDVADEEVEAVSVSCDVGLLIERVLIEGDEIGVAEEAEG